MANYIELQTAIDFIKNNTPTIGGMTTLECVERALYNAPNADVQEVVRCKACNKWKEHPDGTFIRRFGYCKECMMDMPADGFCSYGERKTDNVNDHCND